MKTIVMTGATSGIGLAAADEMRRATDVRLLIGARNQSHSASETLPLDLADLASVRHFAELVGERLNGTGLNGLVLNAGMQTGDLAQRTQDGLECTFGVNHLAQYLLLRLVMPHLSPEAVIVVTTSNLHDPDTNPIAPPEHADAKRLASGEVQGDRPAASKSTARAYAASKLCNILTARALALSPFATEWGLRVIAFNPGLTPGTRLTRHQTTAFNLRFGVLMSALRLFGRANTLADSGHLLADLALGRIQPPPGKVYASQVKGQLTWPMPSNMASDDEIMAMLWRDSAAMVGLPNEIERPWPPFEGLPLTVS